jgi:hypothetical protein
MRVLRFTLVLTCAALMLAPAARAEKRAALVIGNSQYVNAPPLANPKNDATDVAAALNSLGFDVILGLDLDKRGFEERAREFATLLESAEAGLLFYAGHGLQVAGQNFLVPIDARLEKERDLDFDTVRLDFLLRQMEIDREGKVNIVFLDACRDNPLTRNLARSMGTRGGSVGKGLAEVKTGVGTFIAYSTQPGNVALDGTGRNSPFAAALARHVKTPNQPLTSVMVSVRKDVLAATGGKQVPWDHSALTGDFYFAGRSGSGSGAAMEAPADVSAIEERIKRIEEKLSRKVPVEDPTRALRIMQLEERIRQIDEANKEDQQRLFEVQREQGQDPDESKRTSYTRKISDIMLKMTRRDVERSKLAAEIVKLKGEAGPAADAGKAPK